ncbi:hypothetical protein [Ochrobactrum sp. Marseille-Q0166]|uniref:hypothetical protein n=1 Tax=Ochrobactrum sp. Marseille-Q0166 TaxID=2761105 RepID=UPI0016557889|nr:hypothetical protein [Ochrobactrum sp. Marseille-Q0166]MBC8716139.1 hypothetical protein [Ochrobactrum sp. Marseille-Q0166]
MHSRVPDFAELLGQTEPETFSAQHHHNVRFKFASTVFEANLNTDNSDSRVHPSHLFELEFERQDETNKDSETSAISERMVRQTPAQIRMELGLHSKMNRAELQRMRRSFAASNHPDRLPEEFRLAAEQRMKTANALLDEALAATINAL